VAASVKYLEVSLCDMEMAGRNSDREIETRINSSSKLINNTHDCFPDNGCDTILVGLITHRFTQATVVTERTGLFTKLVIAHINSVALYTSDRVSPFLGRSVRLTPNSSFKIKYHP
jgi:hypothetical protein